jgi:hypothetical protein
MPTATIAAVLHSIPTWGWFVIGYLLFAIAVSPFIACAIHDTSDDDWP